MDVFEALTDAEARGRSAVLVTVVGVEGEPPSHPGAKLVAVDGSVAAGTLGCSEFDTAGLELAASLNSSAGSDAAATLRRRVVFGHGEERALDLFAERYEPRPGVIVMGSNPVGRAVAELATLVGRNVIALEDESDDPAAAAREVNDPLTALRDRPPGPRDAIVLSDHDAPYVDDALRLALGSEAFFVGMLGSRRHAPEVVERLRASGTPNGHLVRLHSPCGLDIGSRTPEEIALSIVAEIVSVERGRSGGSMQVDWEAS